MENFDFGITSIFLLCRKFRITLKTFTCNTFTSVEFAKYNVQIIQSSQNSLYTSIQQVLLISQILFNLVQNDSLYSNKLVIFLKFK